MALAIRRIDCSSDDAGLAIAELRRQLSPVGNVVSPEGKARTIAAFGEPLSPQQVVERICADVAARGLDAVLDYSPPDRRCDARARPDKGFAARSFARPIESADPAYLETIARVRGNILAYQKAILHRDTISEPQDGIELGLLHRPLRRVGVCIPGGAAAYPSSVLMTVVPAQAAGVAEIAVVVPPSPFGGFNTDLLACLPCAGRDRGLSDRRGPGGRVAGVWPGGDRAGAGRQDRRTGQPLRGAGQAARLRHGRHRQHRRTERGGGDRRRIGRFRASSPPT